MLSLLDVSSTLRSARRAANSPRMFSSVTATTSSVRFLFSGMDGRRPESGATKQESDVFFPGTGDCRPCALAILTPLPRSRPTEAWVPGRGCCSRFRRSSSTSETWS